MTTARAYPEFGPALLTSWNMNSLALSPGPAVQGNRFVTSVAPAASVWFPASTTTAPANGHGILVNLDPATNTARTWDLDTRLGLATGLGAHYLDQDVGVVWVSSAADAVHRLDPVGRGQWTWTLPVNPLTHTLRGIRVAPDASLMMDVASSEGPGSVLRLDPARDTLTVFPLPTESTPFDGAFGPDGRYFFCEFATGKIARLDPGTAELVEYPVSGHPLQLCVVEDGTVWFVDGVAVGHLDPATGALTEYAAAGVAPEALTPIPRPRFAPLLGLGGAEPFLDVLCAPAEEAVATVGRATTLTCTTIPITPAPSRPTLCVVDVKPDVTPAAPRDPAHCARYATPTPTLAVARHQDALFATGADFAKSVFRLYEMPLSTVLPEPDDPGGAGADDRTDVDAPPDGPGPVRVVHARRRTRSGPVARALGEATGSPAGSQ